MRDIALSSARELNDGHISSTSSSFLHISFVPPLIKNFFSICLSQKRAHELHSPVRGSAHATCARTHTQTHTHKPRPRGSMGIDRVGKGALITGPRVQEKTAENRSLQLFRAAEQNRLPSVSTARAEPILTVHPDTAERFFVSISHPAPPVSHRPTIKALYPLGFHLICIIISGIKPGLIVQTEYITRQSASFGGFAWFNPFSTNCTLHFTWWPLSHPSRRFQIDFLSSRFAAGFSSFHCTLKLAGPRYLELSNRESIPINF